MHTPPSGTNSTLGALAVLAERDVWAVGNRGSTSNRRTLTEHRGDSGWTVVPSPNSTQPVNYLTDVAAVATDDVWAVGFSMTSSSPGGQGFTLVEHWDGSAWTIVPSPNPTPDFGTGYPVSNFLYGVKAFGPDNVWAVGQSADIYSSGIQPLVLHWNGVKWRPVAAPHPGRYSTLSSVAGVAANDVWAVGNYDDNGSQKSLVEHFDGSSWSRVPSPNVGPYLNTFLRVSAAAANDVWAVGYHLAVFGASEVYQTSILHWDGATWSVVPSPSANQENNYLYGVEGVSASDAWAVGFFDTGAFELHTLIQHWNGSSWSIVPSADTDGVINELYDVAIGPTGGLWSVGQFFDGSNYHPLVERARDSC